VRLLGPIHDQYVHDRRTDVLSRHLAELVPADAKVLDVGAGDGLIAKKLLQRRPDLAVTATEVLVRPDQHVPVEPFDGRTLDYATGSFDAVVLVDVLHHSDDPVRLLEESRRVARSAIVVKDVMAEGLLSARTLHLMERIANTSHGISIPDTFWTRAEWDEVFSRLGVRPRDWRGRLGLYPFPASLAFERRFHFIALFEPVGDD
jgi:SAM-dependent methyltransferase